MGNIQENTEVKIVEAAKSVFILKGFDGARMQEIANEADINKALLHYYFRSKDKLFKRVFHDIFSQSVSGVASLVENADSFEKLISSFVEYYVKMLKARPYLPNFILHELNRNPEIVVDLIKDSGIEKDKMMQLIIQESGRTDIRELNPIHIIVNVLAMSIFPFVAAPILTGFIFDGDKEAFDSFIDERSQHISSFVKAAVFKNFDK